MKFRGLGPHTRIEECLAEHSMTYAPGRTRILTRPIARRKTV
jgi:hypothetical protein